MKKAVLLLSASLLFANCNNAKVAPVENLVVEEDASEETPIPPPNVYVVGYEKNEKGVKVAKLWINGVVQELTDGARDSEASAVFVSGDTVYVGGNDGKVAKLWKNGKAQSLSDGVKYGKVNSIYVLDGNAYVKGQECDGRGCVSKFWVNGFEQDGSKETFPENPHSIDFSTDIEKIFSSQTKTKTTDLPAKANKEMISFLTGASYATDSANYVAGTVGNVVKIWKNGEALYELTDGVYETAALSVFVINDDVYVSGYEKNAQRKTVAKLWKNGEAQALTDGKFNAEACGVFVK